MTLDTSDWHGRAAWTLENEHLRVVIIPELGAKIASVFDKQAKREWLLPPTETTLRLPTYAAAYDAYEMTGFDEMFPTIIPCAYPAAKLSVTLPDHGEVWALGWQVVGADGDTLTLAVEGLVLNYRLERSARLDGATLILSYTAKNPTNALIPYLWAAHPVDAQTEIVLPSTVREVVNVMDQHGAWGPAGTRYPWPDATTSDMKAWDLRRIGPAALHDCRKFYIPPELAVGWAALRQRDSGAFLRFEWDSAALPYLGIWIDEGTYREVPTIALEPTNAYYDGLDIAYAAGRYSELPPNGASHWELRLTVGQD